MFGKEWKEMVEKVKTHLEEHKTVYLVTGTAVICLTTGAVAGVALSKNGGQFAKIAQQGFFWKSPPINTINQIKIYLGDPGNHVRCIETQETWLSQGEAARANNVSPTTMANHLHGRRDHVGGLHFEIYDDHGLEILKKRATEAAEEAIAA